MTGFSVNRPARDDPAERGNMVVTGRRAGICFDFAPGDFSIKTVLEGQVTYETSDGQYEMTPDTFLVLNEEQVYRLESPAEFPSQTFCVFFRPEYLRQAAEAVAVRGLTGFYERLQLVPDGLAEPLRMLRKIVADGLQGTMEGECAFADVTMALVATENAAKEANRLDTLRPAVREDLYRRLNRARDYALSNISRPLSLDDLAAAAAMSPFYFHRLHKQAFDETPHEFVSRGRMARAKRLLRAGYAVEEVTVALGYASSATFWRMFKASTGQTPAAFRKIG